MVDPGESSNTASSAFIYGSTFALAVLGSLIIMILYNYKDVNKFFSITLFVIFPILMYFCSSALSIAGQKIACGRVNVSQAFLGGLPTLLSIFVFLFISSFRYARLPIVSVFSSLMNKGIESHTLEIAEQSNPVLKGIAVGYYMFFAVMFGQVITSSLSQSCGL
jgi:hypothetical protein